MAAAADIGTQGLSSSATVLMGSVMTLSLIPVYDVADVVLWRIRIRAAYVRARCVVLDLHV